MNWFMVRSLPGGKFGRPAKPPRRGYSMARQGPDDVADGLKGASSLGQSLAVWGAQKLARVLPGEHENENEAPDRQQHELDQEGPAGEPQSAASEGSSGASLAFLNLPVRREVQDLDEIARRRSRYERRVETARYRPC